jgi:integrase
MTIRRRRGEDGISFEHRGPCRDQAAKPAVPPHVAVWRSVRTHGETKTERSRRTLGLPQVAVQALRAWSGLQADERLAAGDGWQDTALIFTTHHGAALDAGNVRKMFKRICAEAGIGDGWTPRELRTSFVSLMSHRGVSIEEIARLAGHASTRTTEIVYRRELRPVITTGAEIMDELFTETSNSLTSPRAAEELHKPAAGL